VLIPPLQFVQPTIKSQRADQLLLMPSSFYHLLEQFLDQGRIQEFSKGGAVSSGLFASLATDIQARLTAGRLKPERGSERPRSCESAAVDDGKVRRFRQQRLQLTTSISRAIGLLYGSTVNICHCSTISEEERSLCMDRNAWLWGEWHSFMPPPSVSSATHHIHGPYRGTVIPLHLDHLAQWTP
jgi:hypothetical protein